VILRVLAWLILAYRRWLSGRGPLRKVRCSFAHAESCSAYGLRATAEAATAREAIGRIMRRLGRCRDACLLGDGRTLSWAALHDRPIDEIAAELRRDGEREPAIARMLGTRRAVAIWRGELAAARALARLAPAERPLVCSHEAAQSRSRRRLAGVVASAGVAAFAIVSHPWLGAAALGVAAVAAAQASRTAASRAARFALHAALARRWAQARAWAAARRARTAARPAHLRASVA